MRDIIPPASRPEIPPEQPVASAKPEEHQPEPSRAQMPHSLSIPQSDGLAVQKKKKSLKIIIVVVLVVMVSGIVGMYTWYQKQLGAVTPGSTQRVRVVVKEGMSPDEIGATLDSKGLLRSKFVYDWYVRTHKVGNSLQAGFYTLGPGMPLAEIIKNLSSGRTDTFQLTFFPGATLRDNSDTPLKKKTDVKSILERAGYKDDDIEAALNKQYDHPLFASKPASSDIEGYVYGETYEFTSSSTPEEILTKTFDQMYNVVKDNNLVLAYKKQGLSLYEGITLASIIQREVASPSDEKRVAGVFYNRREKGITLGSDVTYQYIADKTDVPRDPNLDSPYNTRRYKGLPPGPIASPGETALLAVAHPTKSHYLFFLSGDDDKTYFGKTQAEHEANIKNHCQKKCQIL